MYEFHKFGFGDAKLLSGNGGREMILGDEFYEKTLTFFLAAFLTAFFAPFFTPFLSLQRKFFF